MFPVSPEKEKSLRETGSLNIYEKDIEEAFVRSGQGRAECQ